MIEVVQGNILDQDVDAIVNPANSHLNHGGGLARVIADAASGPKPVNPGMDERAWYGRERLTDLAADWQAEQRNHPLIPTGGAGWTSAGALPFKGIIHAVGPVWGGGEFFESALLERAVHSAFDTGDIHGCKSIAIPAISCGIFGYPLDLATDVIATTAAWCSRAFEMDVVLVAFEPEQAEAFSSSL